MLVTIYSRPFRRMPVRNGRLFCYACVFHFFITRVGLIFETAESTLAPNMEGRIGLTKKDLSVSLREICPDVFCGMIRKVRKIDGRRLFLG